jgi:hypothetical protein
MLGALVRKRRIIQACGKVPYRVCAGFWPVNRLRNFPDRSDPGSMVIGRYNDKGAVLADARTEVPARKRKKEGLNILVGVLRSGCTGSSATGYEANCPVSERVQLQQ